MTPEEHIERAEWLLTYELGTDDENRYAVEAAAVHVAIADHKKRFPPDSGRPRPAMPSADGQPFTDNPQA